MPQKIDSSNLHLAITITITALPHHDSPINLELVSHPSLHVVTEVHILQDLSDYATTNRSKARILAKQVNVLMRVVWSQSSPPPAGAAGRVFPPKKLHQKKLASRQVGVGQGGLGLSSNTDRPRPYQSSVGDRLELEMRDEGGHCVCVRTKCDCFSVFLS